MSAVGYSVVTGGVVALSAATAKTIIGVKAHANSGLQLKYASIGFDGILTGKVSVLVELCYATFATNSPGTNSTSLTPTQRYGRVLTAGFTAARTWTSEPTALTVLDEWLLTPNAGLMYFQLPLSTEPDTALGEGLVIRCTAPDAVNARATMGVERI